MRNTQRLLALAGMTLAAGAAFGSGTAFAADGHTVPSANHGITAFNHDPGNGRWHNGRDTARVAGVFSSLRSCEFAGYIGERRRAWDDFDCDRIGWRTYVLEVERGWGQWRHQGNWGGNNGHNGGWNGHNGGWNGHDGGWNGHDGNGNGHDGNGNGNDGNGNGNGNDGNGNGHDGHDHGHH